MLKNCLYGDVDCFRPCPYGWVLPRAVPQRRISKRRRIVFVSADGERVVPEDDIRYRRIDMSETHAYEARMAFLENISAGEASVDLAMAALQIATEDDALVSHSSVKLPVEAFSRRIDSIVRDLVRLLDETDGSPAAALNVVEQRVFRTEGFAAMPFGRSNLPAGVRVDNPGVYENSRYAYLHEVLIRKKGLPCTLAILYNAVCQRLLRLGALPCAMRIDCSNLDAMPWAEPLVGLTPEVATTGSGAVLNTCSSQALVEMLRYLKRCFWPFPWETPAAGPGSLHGDLGAGGFLGAAQVALEGADSADLQAISRVAKYRLERGIWTSPGGGDIRRAKAAAERLVLLCGSTEPLERRDLGVLLFHVGDLPGAYAELRCFAQTAAARAAPREHRRALEKLLQKLVEADAAAEKAEPLSLEAALRTPPPVVSLERRISLPW
eukprot:jgi/Botrbrau1/21934/Bobra.0249s0057.1